jgi:hypothetical protein
MPAQASRQCARSLDAGCEFGDLTPAFRQTLAHETGMESPTIPIGHGQSESLTLREIDDTVSLMGYGSGGTLVTPGAASNGYVF